MWFRVKTNGHLTGAGFGLVVLEAAVESRLAAALHRPVVGRDAVRRTLGARVVIRPPLVRARRASCKDTATRKSLDLQSALHNGSRQVTHPAWWNPRPYRCVLTLSA